MLAALATAFEGKPIDVGTALYKAQWRPELEAAIATFVSGGQPRSFDEAWSIVMNFLDKHWPAQPQPDE